MGMWMTSRGSSAHSTVVTVVEEDESDANHAPLQRESRCAAGRWHARTATPLEVLTLPMPRKIVRDGQRLPASYANFYIANRVVLLPVFADPNDALAIAVLQKAFPERNDRAHRLSRADLGAGRLSLSHATTTPPSMNRLLLPLLTASSLSVILQWAAALDPLFAEPNLWAMKQPEFMNAVGKFGYRWTSNAQDSARVSLRGKPTMNPQCPS